MLNLFIDLFSFIFCGHDKNKEQQALTIYNENLSRSIHSITFPIFIHNNLTYNIIFLNFIRRQRSNLNIDNNSFQHHCFTLLKAFKTLILKNETTHIIQNSHNKKILERIGRIDFLANKNNIDKLFKMCKLTNIIPFNTEWNDRYLKFETYFGFGDMIEKCKISDKWFIYTYNFAMELDNYYKKIVGQNLFNSFRKTQKNEFPVTVFKDSDNQFWCLAFHGTPTKEIGRKIGRTNFIASSNGLYGPGVYFSNMLQKNLQYTQDNGHILVCFVCLGDNPVFTTSNGSVPMATSIIALGGIANYGRQVHTEIIIQDVSKIITLYSLTLENKDICLQRGHLTPITYEYSNINKKSNLIDISSISINMINSVS